MPRFTRIARLVAPLAAAALLTGCPPQEGEEGLMTFDVEDRVAGLFGGVPPLAVGVDVPIIVEGVGPLSPSGIRDASIEPASAARVRVEADNRLIVTGLRPGAADLVVKTSQGEERLAIELARTTRIEPISAAGNGRVVVGGIERFMVARHDNQDRLIAGERGLQGAVKPAGIAEVVDGEAHAAHLRYRVPGEHTISVDALAIDRVVVPLDQIEALRYGREQLDDDTATRRISAWAIDTDGERVDGLEGVLTVESGTPEICTARVVPSLFGSAIDVEVHAAGDCRIESTLGAVERSDTFAVE